MSASRGMRRIGSVAAIAAIVLAVSAVAAEAHATMSPPVAKAKTLQYFTLAVPTEKENATTTKIELDLPSGFAVDSFEAAPGWKRAVKSTGSGESAVVQSITWTGGKTPSEEDSVFHLLATANSAKTYKFVVHQTYSDGSVVDWSGPESSDSPAPLVEAKSNLGGGGGTSTLAVIALIVAGIAVVLAIVGLAGGRRAVA